jgi:hypothetical protein
MGKRLIYLLLVWSSGLPVRTLVIFFPNKFKYFLQEISNAIIILHAPKLTEINEE